MSDNAIEKILNETERFLRQERQMYGNVMYRDRPPVASSSTVSTAPVPEEYAERPMPTKKLEISGAINVAAEPKQRNSGGWSAAADLKSLNDQICTCQQCGLGKTRTKFVFGVGNPNADLLVIGEAPGADEDAQGEPFVGRAGQLLNKILEAVHFKREEVYIANILKCRPPENRRPKPEEVEQCEPYLWKQIELIKPKFILCLGLTAAQTLLKTEASLTSLRASVHTYHGVPTFVTYHPAALLRNPNWKRPTWEDVQKLRKMYDEAKKN